MDFPRIQTLVVWGILSLSAAQGKASNELWSECTLTCGGGTQYILKNKTNIRFCNTMNCPGDAGCLSAYLSFDHVTGKTIYDESHNGNLATMSGTAKIIKKGKFGKALKLTKNGSVSFDVVNFHNRPSIAITIALWLKLSQIKGSQEIFFTCGKPEMYSLGAYHIGVDEGIVKWSQKKKDGSAIFSVQSVKPMNESEWYHIAGTYRLSTGRARLYINGHLTKETKANQEKRPPKLDDHWACADMGNPRDKKPLKGFLDEFYIFKCELLPGEISELFSKNAVKKFDIPQSNVNLL